MVNARQRRAAPDGDLATALHKLNSDHIDEQSGACVVLALKANLSTVDGRQLAQAVPRLAQLLRSEDLVVQKNAATALANSMERHDTCWEEAVRCNVGQLLVELLTTDSGRADDAMHINGLAGCGCLIEGGAEGMQQVLDANFVDAWLRLVAPSGRPPSSRHVAEAAVDTLCKLAIQPQCRPELVEKGVVPALASLLASQQDKEVYVRVMLGLGMLVGLAGALQQLAGCRGAVQQLVALMRQTDDEDCRQLATDLFRALGSDSATKAVLKEILTQPTPGQAT